MVHGRRSTGIDIEGYAKFLERLFNDGMVLIHNACGNALLSGLNGYGNTVFIRAAYGNHIDTLHSEIARIDVRGT